MQEFDSGQREFEPGTRKKRKKRRIRVPLALPVTFDAVRQERGDSRAVRQARGPLALRSGGSLPLATPPSIPRLDLPPPALRTRISRRAKTKEARDKFIRSKFLEAEDGETKAPDVADDEEPNIIAESSPTLDAQEPLLSFGPDRPRFFTRDRTILERDIPRVFTQKRQKLLHRKRRARRETKKLERIAADYRERYAEEYEFLDATATRIQSVVRAARVRRAVEELRAKRQNNFPANVVEEALLSYGPDRPPFFSRERVLPKMVPQRTFTEPEERKDRIKFMGEQQRRDREELFLERRRQGQNNFRAGIVEEALLSYGPDRPPFFSRERVLPKMVPQRTFTEPEEREDRNIFMGEQQRRDREQLFFERRRAPLEFQRQGGYNLTEQQLDAKDFIAMFENYDLEQNLLRRGLNPDVLGNIGEFYGYATIPLSQDPDSSLTEDQLDYIRERQQTLQIQRAQRLTGRGPYIAPMDLSDDEDL
jgi:hypothetical protein